MVIPASMSNRTLNANEKETKDFQILVGVGGRRTTSNAVVASSKLDGATQFFFLLDSHRGGPVSEVCAGKQKQGASRQNLQTNCKKRGCFSAKYIHCRAHALRTYTNAARVCT